jgi:hypothetical protein
MIDLPLPPSLGVVTEEGGDLTERRVAVFSIDRLYRYCLAISWDPGLPVLVVIMLNPSTADHLQNDPTIHRICKRAARGGFGGVMILNAFAWRDTKPEDMMKARDPVGPHNDLFLEMGISLSAATSGRLLVGWGNEGGFRGRSNRLAAMIADAGAQAYCVYRCANGQPGHPLYVSYDAEMAPWP